MEEVKLRPIELIYSNEHPYALSEVRIFGKTLNPADYEIRAVEGVIVLKYHLMRASISLREEDE